MAQKLKYKYEIQIFFKENKFFGSWKKRYLALSDDSVAPKMLIFNSQSKNKIVFTFEISEIEIRDFEGSSKSFVNLITIQKKKSFLIAPVLSDSKVLASRKAYNHYQLLQKLIVEKGGSQLEKIKKKKVPLINIFNSTPEFNPTSSTQGSRIEYIDVGNWTIDDVQLWLSFLRYSDGKMMKEEFSQIFKENDINGQTLLSLNDKSLKGMGIKSLGKRLKILKEIKKVKSSRTYRLNEHHVMSKFEKMSPQWLKSVGNLEERVQSLCDIKKIKKTYLDPKRYQFMDLKPEDLQKQNKKEEEEEEDDNENDENNYDDDADAEEILKNQKELTAENLMKGMKNEGDEIPPSDEGTIPVSLPQKEKTKKISVKLIITEILQTNSKKNLRHILSPIVSTIPPLSTKFGIFHTALVVGPWYLEWTDSSLCIPKKISSSMSLLAMDVDTLTVQESELPVIADKLAQLVVDWNVNYEYVNFKITGKKKNEKNCQDFVDAVLQKLGIQPNFEGALSDFLYNMRVHGKADLVFKPGKDFRQEFELTEQVYTFDSHVELDNFVKALEDKSNTFVFDYPSEAALLKSFDRAFWIRHFKHPKEQRYQPEWGLGKDDNQKIIKVAKCPFNDPRKTRTLMAE